MSNAYSFPNTAFRRPSGRQYPLVAEAFLDFKDLLKGGPVLTSTTAKPGISEAGDVTTSAIEAASGSSLTGVQFNLFALPAGAVIIGGDIKVLTAFNSGTSDVLILGYDSTGNQYTNGSTVDLQSAARTALTIPSRLVTTPEYVKAKWTRVGADPTAGQVLITFEYIIAGRSVENQGV